jgi:hypothetical protein
MNSQGSRGALELVLKAASYTYAPLLGLFAFGMCTGRGLRGGGAVVWVCLLAPALSFAVEWVVGWFWGYRVGYELLLLNGLLTFVGLWMVSMGRK